MTAIAADFNYVLVYRIFAMLTAKLLVISGAAIAQLICTFVIVFHLRKSSLDF